MTTRAPDMKPAPAGTAETAPHNAELSLDPVDNQRLANLCGQFDSHLKEIERRLGVGLSNRGHVFRIVGSKTAVETARKLLAQLYADSADAPLTPAHVDLMLQSAGRDEPAAAGKGDAEPARVNTRRSRITPRGANQLRYVENIHRCDINFGIGPAGTGKTYLAVACAVEALEREQVRRILLVRPAVEAGERLGFLPGDLAQKIDPYLRPLYDALYEMLGFERVGKLVDRNVIEVAPLAYMRGRTLNESFIILDEAQNTTIEQMKMFLTRIGFGSTVVVTGDVTQVDLPRDRASGLRHVIEILKDIEGISFVFFQSGDVVRHPLVQRIVAAYEQAESSQAGPKRSGGAKERDSGEPGT
jgi:phosphate starvation-inducible protein PhoH and related proteins